MVMVVLMFAGTATFMLMETLHALQACLSSPVLLLKLGDLRPHRMQLLELVLEALLLSPELLMLLLLLRILEVPHLLHCVCGAPWRQPRGSSCLAHFAIGSSGRVRRCGSSGVCIEEKADLLRALSVVEGCLVPVIVAVSIGGFDSWSTTG